MNNLNSILIEGNLVRDPELKSTPSGTSICKFSIAVERWYKSGENMEKEVSYFDVESWAKMGEYVSAKAKKGRGCRVVGRLKQERWDDAEGKHRSKVVIVAEHVELRSEFTKDGQNASCESEPSANDIEF